MKALTLHAPGDVVYESIDDPAILFSTDAIVKVKECAICGSDLHPYFGRESGLDNHAALGHEFVGEVVEVGQEVTQFAIGDQVMSPFTTNCGECYYCRSGLTARCERGQLFGWVQNGIGLHGGQAEYVRVPMANSTLQKIPAGVTSHEALLLGDVLSTGYFCADRADIREGDDVAVIGCGPVGLMAICAAQKLGARNVYALDTIHDRLMLANNFGAKTVNVGVGDELEKLKKELSIGCVMDAVGNRGSNRTAFELVRPGGTVSTVGVNHEENFAFSPNEAYDKNITFRVGRCPARYYMAKLVPWVREKKFDFTSIFSHTMKLSEGAAAYDLFANKRDNCTKVLLVP